MTPGDAPPDINFAKLTSAQRKVLGLIAIGEDRCHHPKTLATLEDKGLIAGADEVLRGGFPVTIRRYHVPLPVHIQWCAWCAANTEEALPQ